MSKLIQKSGYFKPHENHSSAYMKYIATRDGVEKVTERFADRPPSQKQQDLIRKILHDYPDAKELFEYEDYLAQPNVGNASDFISMALDSNWGEASSSQIYMQYISTRPRTEKHGGHGLFSDGDAVDLDAALETLAAHDGNVYTFILSLRREDAARLGYDNAAAWQSVLKEHRGDVAEALKIPDDELHWYAAFHNESHHPHIHMMAYGDDPKAGYLNTVGIHKMRSALTNTIFKQEMLNLYKQKSVSRDELVQSARSAMAQLVGEMQTGVCDNSEIAVQVSVLAEQLKTETGKMQYGYLKPRLKTMVDEIVDTLERIPSVEQCYQYWLELRAAVQNYYTGDAPEYIPLSHQKEFKQIRNMVIREALNVANGVLTFEDTEEPAPVPDELLPETPLPTDTAEADDPPPESGSSDGGVYVDWTDDYKAALEYLYGTDEIEPDFTAALTLMETEAENGNALAMHDMAKMYAGGLGCEADAAVAHAWYAKALSAFQACEAAKPWKYTEYRIGKLYAAGLGTEQDYALAAEWFSMAAAKRHKYAQYSLGGLYYRGNGVARSYEQAFRLYAESAAQGFPYASYELAKLYRDGIGTVPNAKSAAAHFENAFRGFVTLEKKSHDDKLQYRIGQMLLTGTGTEKDINLAAKYFEKSARLGNTYAQYQLAKLYLADETADEEKIQRAIRWLEESAEGENQFAQYTLGKLYRDADHVPLDERRAAELFAAAAEQGSEYAAYAIGKLYLGTETMEKNIPGALRWLGAAAGMGNQFAQYQLGKLYLTGEDVPKDVTKAVERFTASAEQGNQYAQYALGKLYLLGKDVPQDKETALRWLEQSAAQGNPYAQFFIDHANDYAAPSALLSATRLLHHLGNIFRDNSVPPGNAKGIRIDSKRRRKLHEMKVAAGHAEDEQDSEYTQIMSY